MSGLVAAIRRLAADKAERARLGTNAHNFFLKHYEYNVCCTAWADLLTEVAQR